MLFFAIPCHGWSVSGLHDIWNPIYFIFSLLPKSTCRYFLKPCLTRRLISANIKILIFSRLSLYTIILFRCGCRLDFFNSHFQSNLQTKNLIVRLAYISCEKSVLTLKIYLLFICVYVMFTLCRYSCVVILFTLSSSFFSIY